MAHTINQPRTKYETCAEAVQVLREYAGRMARRLAAAQKKAKAPGYMDKLIL